MVTLILTKESVNVNIKIRSESLNIIRIEEIKIIRHILIVQVVEKSSCFLVVTSIQVQIKRITLFPLLAKR